MPFPVATPEPTAAKPRPLYRDFAVLQLAALAFLLDQLTKYLVIQLLAPGFSFPFRGFFRFTHVHNTGSAFGILQGLNTPLIFVSFIGIIILVLIYRSQPHPSNWLRLSLALQLGGAFGNLIDRVRLGYVTDFIDIGPWPVFNLADASIVTGLIILAWVLTRSGSPKEQVASELDVSELDVSELDVSDTASDALVNDLEYRNAVSPHTELVEGGESSPVVDLTVSAPGETPPTLPTLVEDTAEGLTEPERP